MTPEELMKPRYKVIADWPGNNCFKPGEVFYADDKRTENKPVWTNLSFEEMPHLFHPLAWWEDREAADLPQFVIWAKTGEVRKVDHFDLETDNMYFMHLELCPHPYFPGFSDKGWLPATEADYIKYRKLNNL